MDGAMLALAQASLSPCTRVHFFHPWRPRVPMDLVCSEAPRVCLLELVVRFRVYVFAARSLER
eukprot:2004620-Lingulodinium_polyedra.AAC.1